MPGRKSCAVCWRLNIPNDEAEAFLTGLRTAHPGIIVQVFGSDHSPNPTAVEMIANQTLAAEESGTTLAEKPELDLLLRLAGTKQIGAAFARLGYRSAKRSLFVVAASRADGRSLERMVKRLSSDGKIVRLPEKPLAEEDYEMVERAALLAADV